MKKAYKELLDQYDALEAEKKSQNQLVEQCVQALNQPAVL